MMGGEMSQGISTSLFWMAHIIFVGTEMIETASGHTYSQRRHREKKNEDDGKK